MIILGGVIDLRSYHPNVLVFDRGPAQPDQKPTFRFLSSSLLCPAVPFHPDHHAPSSLSCFIIGIAFPCWNCIALQLKLIEPAAIVRQSPAPRSSAAHPVCRSYQSAGQRSRSPTPGQSVNECPCSTHTSLHTVTALRPSRICSSLTGGAGRAVGLDN